MCLSSEHMLKNKIPDVNSLATSSANAKEQDTKSESMTVGCGNQVFQVHTREQLANSNAISHCRHFLAKKCKVDKLIQLLLERNNIDVISGTNRPLMQC